MFGVTIETSRKSDGNSNMTTTIMQVGRNSPKVTHASRILSVIFVSIERGEGNTILEGHESNRILPVGNRLLGDTPMPLRVA
jgi:hypothetical protein